MDIRTVELNGKEIELERVEGEVGNYFESKLFNDDLDNDLILWAEEHKDGAIAGIKFAGNHIFETPLSKRPDSVREAVETALTYIELLAHALDVFRADFID